MTLNPLVVPLPSPSISTSCLSIAAQEDTYFVQARVKNPVSMVLIVYVFPWTDASLKAVSSPFSTCHLHFDWVAATTVGCQHFSLYLVLCWVQAEKESRPPTEDEMVGSWFSNPAGPTGRAGDQGGSGVGKYLAAVMPKVQALEAPAGQPQPKKPKIAAAYGNFDAW
jgi:hypothetical protein